MPEGGSILYVTLELKVHAGGNTDLKPTKRNLTLSRNYSLGLQGVFCLAAFISVLPKQWFNKTVPDRKHKNTKRMNECIYI